MTVETILEGRCKMPYFTDLRLVFQAIGQRQQHFNWLITDLEVFWLGVHDERPDPFTETGPYWLSGSTLTKVVEEYKLQFVWAVLSGFPSGVTVDLDRLEPVPYADGNPGFWIAKPQIQHPLAEIEIVCWDSTSTLLLCEDRTIGESFRQYFPEAVDLVHYNQERHSRSQVV